MNPQRKTPRLALLPFLFLIRESVLILLGIPGSVLTGFRAEVERDLFPLSLGRSVLPA